jgi:hypothetical protein
MLDTNHEYCIKFVKETLKFILVPAFTAEKEETVGQDDRSKVQGSEVKD